MAAAPNVYTAEPAHPVLAYSLLTQQGHRRPGHDTAEANAWKLQNDWESGIQTSGSSVFRCGSVVGFSRLRTRINDNGEYVGQVRIKSDFISPTMNHTMYGVILRKIRYLDIYLQPICYEILHHQSRAHLLSILALLMPSRQRPWSTP